MAGLFVGAAVGFGMFFLIGHLPPTFITIASLKAVLCIGAGIGAMGLVNK